MPGPLLELKRVTKRFPGVLANDRISFGVDPGEVVGLLGENGAGKSTLMHIVSGLITPDDGEIVIDGAAVDFETPADAVAAGIGMVHQHFMLVPTLTVTENVVLGDPQSNPFRMRTRQLEQRVAAIGERIGLPVDARARVDTLDIGAQQRVEIIKALHRDARIVILDEPTTVLTEDERQGLFAMIRRLADEGAAVVLISHKLDDIFAVCGRVVVLREGRVVDEAAIEDCSRDRLIESMVGTGVSLPEHHARAPARDQPLITVKDLRARRDNGGTAFQDVSFELRPGEILALAGVEGNGQQELSEVLTGLRPAAGGSLSYDALSMPGGATPRALRLAGVRHIPADRHASAVLQERSLVENQMLTRLFGSAYVENGMLRRTRARADTDAVIERFDVRTGDERSGDERASSGDLAMRALSGGNQQKLVLGRELDDDARLLIAVHPTRGLDIRTVAFVQETLAQKRDQGLGILLISADLSEIWQIADRVMVFFHGRLYGPKPLGEATLQEVGGWMAGH